MWIILQTVNVAWPRTQPDQPWYINWSMVLTTAVLALVGVALYLRQRRYITAPVGERLAAGVGEDAR